VRGGLVPPGEEGGRGAEGPAVGWGGWPEGSSALGGPGGALGLEGEGSEGAWLQGQRETAPPSGKVILKGKNRQQRCPGLGRQTASVNTISLRLSYEISV